MDHTTERWGDDTKDRVNLRLNKEQYIMLRKSARQLGLPHGAMLRSWITQHYNGHDIPGRQIND